MPPKTVDGPLHRTPVDIAVVGIDPPDDLARARRQRLVQRVRLSRDPAHSSSALRATGCRRQQLDRPIGRAAVDDHMLDGAIRLPRDRRQIVGQPASLIERRSEDRNQHSAIHSPGSTTLTWILADAARQFARAAHSPRPPTPPPASARTPTTRTRPASAAHRQAAPAATDRLAEVRVVRSLDLQLRSSRGLRIRFGLLREKRSVAHLSSFVWLRQRWMGVRSTFQESQHRCRYRSFSPAASLRTVSSTRRCRVSGRFASSIHWAYSRRAPGGICAQVAAAAGLASTNAATSSGRCHHPRRGIQLDPHPDPVADRHAQRRAHIAAHQQHRLRARPSSPAAPGSAPTH